MGQYQQQYNNNNSSNLPYQQQTYPGSFTNTNAINSNTYNMNSIQFQQQQYGSYNNMGYGTTLTQIAPQQQIYRPPQLPANNTMNINNKADPFDFLN